MNDNHARSGKRKRVSRVTMVGGQAVLKSNMYDVETGELSVWDRELHKNNDDDNQEQDQIKKVKVKTGRNKDVIDLCSSSDDDNSVVVVAPPAAKVSKVTSDDPMQIQRKAVSDQKKSDRMACNNVIIADKANSLQRKNEFIRLNWKSLSPFLGSADHPPPAPSHPIERKLFAPLTEQPTYLKNVQLRDYQLQGVNWLIKSYEAGINVILGGT